MRCVVVAHEMNLLDGPIPVITDTDDGSQPTVDER
jgi:hypothetical protein